MTAPSRRPLEPPVTAPRDLTIMADANAAQTLSALRARIDSIDEAMHELLIERSSVIDALIAAKGTSESGVAFRPQREAEMMRRLVERHTGNLPLATVEHLWREIISTFTFMQAPFRVVVDFGADAAAMRDLARFAFGFSVDLVPADGPEQVIETVAATGNDLGLIPLGDGIAASPWWRRLSASNGPRLMALWPFIAGERPAADTPAAIISPLLTEPTPSDLVALAASDTRALGTPIAGAAIIAECPTEGGRDILVAMNRADAEMVRDAAWRRRRSRWDRRRPVAVQFRRSATGRRTQGGGQ